jgi:threonine/homoserine/homoserine lactone efflux protein
VADAIGQSIAIAIAAALSPLPIVAVVLMLGTPRARINGPLFVVGWLVGFAIIGVVVLAIVGPSASTTNEPATGVSWLKLALGVGLLGVARRQFAKRPRGDEEPPAPKWMGAVDDFGPGKAALAGVVLSAANPKNLVLAIAGATAIAQTAIPGWEQALAYAIFTLIATIGVAAPVVIYFVMGDRSRDVLDRLKTWMAHNNAVIMAVICLLIGVKLIGDAIGGF